MTIQNWVPAIANLRRINRAVTFFRPKEGGGYFFANTPDMQYFKGRLPPTFRVPLKYYISGVLAKKYPSHPWPKEGHSPVKSPQIRYRRDSVMETHFLIYSLIYLSELYIQSAMKKKDIFGFLKSQGRYSNY